MTQSPADTELTAEAEARLGDYLRQVRAALAGSADVSPDEVEADIREHVENELRTRPRPVGCVELEAVLARLGPPTQWLPAGRAAPPGPSVGQFLRARWRGAYEALWRGPEDWRLPYLSFAVFGLGVIAFPFFPLFLVLSYVLARAGLAAARQKGLTLDGGRGWLLYPPVVIVSLVLLAAVVAAPLLATGGICSAAHDADRVARWELAGRPGGGSYSHDPEKLRQRHPQVVTALDRVHGAFPGPRDVQEVLLAVSIGAGVCAFWWAVVGLLAGRFPGAVRAAFPPFLDGFEGRTARRAGVVALLVFAVWCGAAYRLLLDTGLA